MLDERKKETQTHTQHDLKLLTTSERTERTESATKSGRWAS